MVSARAEIVTRRTYNRPLNEEETVFETWRETVSRVIDHQEWLWTRAAGRELKDSEYAELYDLEQLMIDRKVSVSGRTLWLGGTNIAKTREASQFNCSFTEVETVYDVVDVLWLLLQGCGVGFKPVVGTLNGFSKPIRDIKVIRSNRTEKGGLDRNEEFWDEVNKVWTIKIGDSAEAWAKSIGKLMAGKYPARTLVLDFSELRPAGERLKGYGWISSGDEAISKAYLAIANILSGRADALLTRMDILDIVNWLGTILSSRRSAEICLFDYGQPEWQEFSVAKKDYWLYGNEHRQQSNNSLVFQEKPSKKELETVFKIMESAGGSEPGFINAVEARKRAPWFKGCNPSLRKGTRVYTNKGIVRIEDLENDFFEVKTIDGSWEDAGCKLSGHNKQLYKITLEGGHEYFCTREHTWPVFTKKSLDIWNTDTIKLRTDELTPGQCLKLDMTDSLYPEGKLGSYSDGFFLGWLLSDGWITTRSDNGKKQIGLIVSNKEIEIIAILGEKLRELGSEAKFINRGTSWELNTQNQEVWNWIESFGVKDKKSLPTSIFSSKYSEDYRKGFMDATFSADGNVEVVQSGCGIRVCLSSSSRERISDMADLLGFYGIKTSITSDTREGNFPNGKNYDKEYECHSLRFSSIDSVKYFTNLVTLTVQHKQDRLENIKNCQSKLLGKVRILSVEPTDIYEDVWDIGVYNENHTFRVSQGYTGNCVEILLGNKSFCNLVEIDIGKFKGDNAGLHYAVRLAARANYRQTCVDLRDGILQESWHLNNYFLRLCGVGLTGIVKRPDMTEYDYEYLARTANASTVSMAEELELPYPKNSTCVKPSGTLSKIMDTTEGVHKPLGKYIFNNVNFGIHDPLVDKLRAANYRVINHPSDTSAVLVRLPMSYEDVPFDLVDGVEVNLETAISQLNRYKLLQTSWTQQNTSVTISYDPSEVPEIIDWLLDNWDIYVGVSFLYRNDPTKTAKDLGYEYLPQEVVTKEIYEEYTGKLLPIDFTGTESLEELQEEGCATGACPIK